MGVQIPILTHTLWTGSPCLAATTGALASPLARMLLDLGLPRGLGGAHRPCRFWLHLPDRFVSRCEEGGTFAVLHPPGHLVGPSGFHLPGPYSLDWPASYSDPALLPPSQVTQRFSLWIRRAAPSTFCCVSIRVQALSPRMRPCRAVPCSWHGCAGAFGGRVYFGALSSVTLAQLDCFFCG